MSDLPFGISHRCKVGTVCALMSVVSLALLGGEVRCVTTLASGGLAFGSMESELRIELKFWFLEGVDDMFSKVKVFAVFCLDLTQKQLHATALVRFMKCCK